MKAMRSPLLIAVLLAAAVGAIGAGAQVGAGLEGTWGATVTKPGSPDGSAELVIQGSQGTWTNLARNGSDGHDGCVGHPFPVVVAAQAAGGWRLSIEASTVARGCKNHRVTLKAIDARTLAGELDSGHAVRLVRE